MIWFACPVVEFFTYKRHTFRLIEIGFIFQIELLQIKFQVQNPKFRIQGIKFHKEE